MIRLTHLTSLSLDDEYRPTTPTRRSLAPLNLLFAICYLLLILAYGREDHSFHGERMGVRRAL
jgi:hypothetical protein